LRLAVPESCTHVVNVAYLWSKCVWTAYSSSINANYIITYRLSSALSNFI
jgi:hypothetical protein